METKQELLTLNGKEYLLDIEQAKKLNLLKEKDNRVKSWKEFELKYSKRTGYYYSIINNDLVEKVVPTYTNEQLTPHEAKALAAFSKLLKLRRDWIGEWEPNWENTNGSYGIIWVHKNEPEANTACTLSRPLSFPDYKMAKDFLETFRDLIEDAKILI